MKRHGKTNGSWSMADRLTKELRSILMGKIRSRDTQPELRVRKRLYALGFRFRLCARDLPGTPDIVLRRYRTVIMVHGCLWHGHRFCASRGHPKSNTEYWRKKIPANRERDARKAVELGRLGWRIITIWECETKDPGSIDGKIMELICAKGIHEIKEAAIKTLPVAFRGMFSLIRNGTLRFFRWAKKNIRKAWSKQQKSPCRRTRRRGLSNAISQPVFPPPKP